VTITYQYMVPENQQDAAFHTHGPGNNCLAVVEHKGRKLFIDCVGEMNILMLAIVDGKINEPDSGERMRYTCDIINAGINTDRDLYNYLQQTQELGYDVVRNNSWFEVFSEDDDFGYDVYHEFYEAVDFALAAIKEDEYWDNLHKPENYVV
jgi:hypothetical protein